MSILWTLINSRRYQTRSRENIWAIWCYTWLHMIAQLEMYSINQYIPLAKMFSILGTRIASRVGNWSKGLESDTWSLLKGVLLKIGLALPNRTSGSASSFCYFSECFISANCVEVSNLRALHKSVYFSFFICSTFHKSLCTFFYMSVFLFKNQWVTRMSIVCQYVFIQCGPKRHNVCHELMCIYVMFKFKITFFFFVVEMLHLCVQVTTFTGKILRKEIKYMCDRNALCRNYWKILLNEYYK